MLAACLRRAVTLEWRRNWPALVVRWLISLVISVVAGSIFWQLPATFQGAVSAMGMLFWWASAWRYWLTDEKTLVVTRSTEIPPTCWFAAEGLLPRARSRVCPSF
jgi:hypothetical protein